MKRRITTFEQKKPLLTRVAGPFFFVFMIFYLTFHAVSGERGVLALYQANRKLDVLNVQLSEIVEKRKLLEHKVMLLSDQSLDLDLLDEQAKVVLGMAGKNEVVYFLDKNDAAAQH